MPSAPVSHRRNPGASAPGNSGGVIGDSGLDASRATKADEARMPAVDPNDAVRRRGAGRSDVGAAVRVAMR
jgi:hypothetical protein